MIFGSQNPRPRGVPLGALQELLEPTTLKTSRDGDTLVVSHEKLISRVEVTAPANPELDANKISAIVTIKTPLPKDVESLLGPPDMMVSLNILATLSALYRDKNTLYIGSRLTVYERDDAWNMQVPLLLFSIVAGVDTLLGGIRRVFSKENPKGGDSEWTEADFDFIRSYLSKVSVCTGGGLGLSAEFGLKTGEFAAIGGHRNTALWEMSAEQPHPEMGGGLFCLLQLPYQFSDQTKLDRIINELNIMEMAPHDLPPHFGAWCRGRSNNNPAYVSFLPNALHPVSGIGVNFSYWAMARAQWADAMLITMGAR